MYWSIYKYEYCSSVAYFWIVMKKNDHGSERLYQLMYH